MLTDLRSDITDAILAAQAEDGAFRSFVRLGGRATEDRNGFITALVVRALGHGNLPEELERARGRALDYLEGCESRAMPGAFRFWPEGRRPAWAPELPPDADDTAVIALELHRAGRRPLDWLRRVALVTLMPYRVVDPEPEPSWIAPGTFLTWLVRGPNQVDCVANVNVAALLAAAGLAHVAAYRSVVSTVSAGIDWTEDKIERARLLSPFYADPIELYWALAHAVGSGASVLQPSFDRVARWFPAGSGYEAERPICCSAYGATTWAAPVVQILRYEPGLTLLTR